MKLANSTTTKEDIFTSPAADFWFDHLVDTLKADQVLLKTGIAPKEKENMYSAFIQGNINQLISQNRDVMVRYFISNILIEYVNEIKARNIDTSKIAFDHTNSKVLVWAEVENELEEDNLILAEAKINAKYYDDGFYVSTSIVEKEDKLTMPNHYRKLHS